MSERTYAYFMAFIALVCGWVLVRRSFSPASLTLRDALVQGFFVGFGLAVVTIEIVARAKATRINGWITIFGCGEPGNGMFLGDACARIFPCPDSPSARSDVLENSDGWRGSYALRRLQLRPGFPAGRSSAGRCVLVADYGRRERTFCGESY